MDDSDDDDSLLASHVSSVSDSDDDECRCVECGVRCGYRQLCGRTMCDNTLFGTMGVCTVCDEAGMLLVDDERCVACAEPVACVVCRQKGLLGGGFTMFCMCQAFCNACVDYAGVDCRTCAILGPYVMHGRKVHLLE